MPTNETSIISSARTWQPRSPVNPNEVNAIGYSAQAALHKYPTRIKILASQNSIECNATDKQETSMWHRCGNLMQKLWLYENAKKIHTIVSIFFCCCLSTAQRAGLFRGEQWPIWRNTFAEKHIYVQRSCFICDALLLPLRFIARRRWHVYVTFHCNWIFVDVIRSVGPAGPCMIHSLMIVGKCEK